MSDEDVRKLERELLRQGRRPADVARELLGIGKKVYVVWMVTGEYSDRGESILGDAIYTTKEFALAAARAHAQDVGLLQDPEDPEVWGPEVWGGVVRGFIKIQLSIEALDLIA